MAKCDNSPHGEHQYDLNDYSRDDQGFWIDCIHCHKTQFFNCDSLEELYSMFGLDDDE